LLAGRGQAASKTTRGPTKKPQLSGQKQEDGKETIDFGDEDALPPVGGLKTTPVTWASSEEVNGNTFEPVTSIPSHDDNEDSEEDDDYEDLDKDLIEDDYGLSSTSTVGSTIAITTEEIQETTLATDPDTVLTTAATERVVDTTTIITTTTQSIKRPVIATTRPPTLPSTHRASTSTTTRKPYTPKGASSASTIRISSGTFHFLLAFYSALTLLWKRLHG